MNRIPCEYYFHGCPVNPKLPKKFGCTPNDARPASHTKYWGVPFIQVDTYEQPYKSYQDYLSQWCDLPGYSHMTEQEFNDNNLQRRQAWFTAWPSGFRYGVYCLDGGAWDRPTCWGMFATIEQARDCIYCEIQARKL